MEPCNKQQEALFSFSPRAAAQSEPPRIRIRSKPMSQGHSRTLHRCCVAGAWVFLSTALIGTIASWVSGGLAFDLLRTDTSGAEKISLLREVFADFGVLAPAVYFAFVVVEVVVAPIPGLMLYAPGGAIFGTFVGGSLALCGNTAGAGIACMITRSFRPAALTDSFSASRLQKIQHELERRGVWLVFLLRLNPLTSSDIVSYAAGFTRLPVWKVMMATGVGMAPLCYLQAWLADSLLTSFPGLFLPLMIFSVVFLVCVVVIVIRITKAPAPHVEPEGKPGDGDRATE